MTPAPIAVFAFDRADDLAVTLDALERSIGFAGRRVHVFCDAARGPEDHEPVARTRAAASSWCERTGARLVERPGNLGFTSITDGIGELCAEHGAAISLEDDHVVDPDAIALLDQGLERYRHSERVHQVCAARPGNRADQLPETFFTPTPSPIGWATWDRAWRRFSWSCDGAEDLLASRSERHGFDLGGAYPASTLLEQALDGRMRSYFVRWYFAMYTAGGLSLWPRRSRIRNSGLGSGVHGAEVTERREGFHNGAWLAGAAVDAGSTVRMPEREVVDDAVLEWLRGALAAFSGR